MNILFEPLTLNLFQIAAIVMGAAFLGWLAALCFSLDHIEEFGLHPRPAPPRLEEVLHVLKGLFIAHRTLMWRHRADTRADHTLFSSDELRRAYRILRAYGMSPSMQTPPKTTPDTAEPTAPRDYAAPKRAAQ